MASCSTLSVLFRIAASTRPTRVDASRELCFLADVQRSSRQTTSCHVSQSVNELEEHRFELGFVWPFRCVGHKSPRTCAPHKSKKPEKTLPASSGGARKRYQERDAKTHGMRQGAKTPSASGHLTRRGGETTKVKQKPGLEK